MNKNRRQVQIIGDATFFSYAPITDFSAFEEVYVWDLDKTYLDTHWQSIKDLFKVSFTDNFHRNNVPGTGTLVSALKQSWTQKNGKGTFPIFFITASPPQMEKKIREKLESDNILPLGIFFKDNLKNLWPGRFWKLRQHVGYKVGSLLYLRTLLKENVTQVLWGDDSETDAIIYSLYSDLCSRRLAGDECDKILKNFQVTNEQFTRIESALAQIPVVDPVEKIYINLAIDTDPEYYLKFGRRMIPSYNALQIALDLYQDGRLSLEHVLQVGKDLLINYSYSTDELQRSVDELIRRQVIGEQTYLELKNVLAESGLIHSDYIPSIAPSKIIIDSGEGNLEVSGVHEPWVPERIDYLHDYR
ncbi:MAG: hypothetical protein IT287_01910 [Bdellovibrionaceae bacterium]|nr:hypothetical protein [Pseudobdellovibrionaceae bacterium]